jgi:hypothetical protein
MISDKRTDRQLGFPEFAGPAPRMGPPGPPCLRCGGSTVVSPGVGPHHARIDCVDAQCGAWRWAPKPRPGRDGGRP